MPQISLNTSKKTKQTAAGEIPVDWGCVKLGDLIAQPISGVSVLADENPPESGKPGVLRLSCVTGGRFDPTDLKSPQNGQEKRLSVAAEHNTILISRSNTPNLVGESAYVSGEHPTAYLPDTLWLLRPKEADTVSMRWLGYMLRSSHYRRLLKQIASGTSQSMKKIQKGALLKLHAATPPLPEQRKIADILTTWDEAIEKFDALIAAKERRKKAIMQRLLHGRVRLKGFTEGWHSAQFGDFLSESRIAGSDGSRARKLTVKLYGRGVKAKEDRLNGSESTKYYIRKAGQFIYSKLDFLNGAFGIVPPNLDGYETTLDLPCFEVAPSADERWLLYFVSRPEFYTQQLGSAAGGRKARRVNPPEFLAMRVRIPPIDEQKAIGEILDTCDAELTLLRRQRAALDLQKRGLMQRLLTGRIRVNTGAPDEEP